MQREEGLDIRKKEGGNHFILHTLFPFTERREDIPELYVLVGRPEGDSSTCEIQVEELTW